MQNQNQTARPQTTASEEEKQKHRLKRKLFKERMQTEKKTLKDENIEGTFLDSDMDYFKTVIQASKDTAYGDCDMHMSFIEHDFDQAPRIDIVQTLWHPNVDPRTGQIPLGGLMEWSPDTKIVDLVIFVKNLLASPNLKDPVNREAADQYRTSPETWKEMVQAHAKRFSPS